MDCGGEQGGKCDGGSAGSGIQMTAGGPASAFLWSPIVGRDFATLRLSCQFGHLLYSE